ncbi:hypothetical protein L7F22_002227 [Adiantum nelumboides]|nr:hypothetical protein [Adiantum nelumboides]
MATHQHQSSTRPIHNTSTSMEEDDHPEWIDILVACHPQVTEGDISSQIYSRNSILESKESEIMNEIKGLIFYICQATNRGIPTVLLEEMVLKSHMHPHGDVIALADVHESIRSDEGIATNLYWKDQTRNPVIGLLLPHELRYHLLNHVQAIEHIQAKFADGSNMPYTDQQKRKGIGSSDVNMIIPAKSKHTINRLFDMRTFIQLKKDALLRYEGSNAVAKQIKPDIDVYTTRLQEL